MIEQAKAVAQRLLTDAEISTLGNKTGNWMHFARAIEAAVIERLGNVENRNTETHEHLSTLIGLWLGARERGDYKYQDGSVVDKAVKAAIEHLKDWPFPELERLTKVDVEPCCANWKAGTNCFADPYPNCPHLKVDVEPELSKEMEYAAQDEFHILPPRMRRLWKRMHELVPASALAALQQQLDEMKAYAIEMDRQHCENQNFFMAQAKELRAENDRLREKLIECRSSVKFNCNDYDRFMLRKEPHANQCGYDEQKRLHDLRDYIDTIIEQQNAARAALEAKHD